MCCFVDYVEHGSETAFGGIVARYTNLVYSAALRQRGSSDLACDVAQSPCTDLELTLARKSPSLVRRLRNEDTLAGWLYRGALYAATKYRRDESRRQARERQFMQDSNLASETSPDWERVRPFLDAAMSRLGEQDRSALLLRFFQSQDFQAVGLALGVSEDAAQKRVARALEKLRVNLTRRGAPTTIGALSIALSANAVQTAPVGLAATLTGASLAGAVAPTGTALTLLKIMTLTKLKLGVLSSLVILGLSASLVKEHQSQVNLREENRTLRERFDKFAQLIADNGQIVHQTAQSLSTALMNELLRLRGEVGGQREQSKELAKLRAALAAGQNIPSGKSASAASQMEAIPKESWTNAGYGTPEAAFQTICYAMSKGDLQLYLDSVSPEQQTDMKKQLQGKSETEIAAGQMAEMGPVKDFQVVGKIEVGEDQVQMLVHTAGEDLNTLFIMTNVNGGWKFANMVKEN